MEVSYLGLNNKHVKGGPLRNNKKQNDLSFVLAHKLWFASEAGIFIVILIEDILIKNI